MKAEQLHLKVLCVERVSGRHTVKFSSGQSHGTGWKRDVIHWKQQKPRFNSHRLLPARHMKARGPASAACRDRGCSGRPLILGYRVWSDREAGVWELTLNICLLYCWTRISAFLGTEAFEPITWAVHVMWLNDSTMTHSLRCSLEAVMSCGSTDRTNKSIGKNTNQ